MTAVFLLYNNWFSNQGALNSSLTDILFWGLELGMVSNPEKAISFRILKKLNIYPFSYYPAGNPF